MRTAKRLERRALEKLRDTLLKRDKIREDYRNNPQLLLKKFGYLFEASGLSLR